mmetsp:Transcript_730/g.1254  ORF Transcript_730/g.1254 Transcript_730/m.1254 type:complete len:281 (+) Transcript_730:27-869(+)|eukprot:CAMPEP_0119302538 /NCGR_PEP_ID=MMETSP1333-20130426/4121_1 /TAXON_ID=418940 /ORGANISM="Scyphosphaera apsteinii, Strain RCC1455" /LENGTH=280 /DNA_ID=CAMNT_0007304923 /DNA_START=18 /DNA_END=860 /DNA_ORIENTATION=+
MRQQFRQLTRRTARAETPWPARAACSNSPAPRSLLLEVGANNGAWTAAMLLGKSDDGRERSKRNRTQFDSVYLFEPNPRFNFELGMLVSRFGAKHVRAAAWVHDGNVSFHLSKNDESSSIFAYIAAASKWSGRWRASPRLPAQNWTCQSGANAWDQAMRTTYANATALNDNIARISRRDFNKSICDSPRTLQVASVDLANFLWRSACPSDRIVAKLDIEGAEYKVLSRLLDTGTACWISELSIEYHRGPCVGKLGKNCTLRQRLKNCTRVGLHGQRRIRL